MAGAGAGRARVRLADVDDQLRDACLALRVRDDQALLVATNEKSLRQAKADPSLVPRALLEGDEVVGFVMYQRRPDGAAYVWRVMVDAKHQGRGLGRRMLDLLVGELGAQGYRRVFISHRPYNPVAERLFESLGFQEWDIEPDGEVVRLLTLPPVGRPPPA